MKYTLTLLLTIIIHTVSFGQQVAELYRAKNYKELAKLEPNAGKLNADELYMVGFAFFQLTNDAKAVSFYDKAIAKGLNNAAVHYNRAMSLRMLKKYDDALTSANLAVKMTPSSQDYLQERGLILYAQKKYDEARESFVRAAKTKGSSAELFYWIARSYHEQKDLKNALPAYYEAAKNIPKTNNFHLTALKMIGMLEFSDTKNFEKSAAAYENALALKGDDYELRYRLIKSYNAAKNYKKAEEAFAAVKTAFDHGKLPKGDMDNKSISIDQFEWGGQKATVVRSLVTPEKPSDMSYKIFLFNKAGDNIDRRFLVEKAPETSADNLKYILAEEDRQSGAHITYPYGWASDSVPLSDLQKAIAMVLDGKLDQGAKSTPGK